jgi:hypothetical protein
VLFALVLTFAHVILATRSIAALNYDFEDTTASQVESIRAAGSGQAHFVANFRIELRLEEADMKFTVSCNGNEIDTATVDYD